MSGLVIPAPNEDWEMTFVSTAPIPPLQILQRLIALREDILREGHSIFDKWQPDIRRREFRIGARNLANFLALRRHDHRDLQVDLPPLGLSSLGHSEARIMANLDSVIVALAAICGEAAPRVPEAPSFREFYRGDRLLDRNATKILGPVPEHRRVRIMVTLPTEAASDYRFIRDLAQRGMSIVRINGAHDDPQIWSAMVDHARRAEAETGQPIRIVMDIGGPKARTGEVLRPRHLGKLRVGSQILLTRSAPVSQTVAPFQVECLIPEVIDHLVPGNAVWIDDGKIGTTVESVGPEGAHLRVTHAPPKGAKIRSEKGLNFPDTELRISPITDSDQETLDFIVQHADAVEYSFVQSAGDIDLLEVEIERRWATRVNKRPLGIVAKIETSRAVRNLPEIIVRAAAKRPLAVMIARGDLAVEIGYQRLAEIQEEILWICEAAHIPVVWATQVLETLVKKGIPSRAEMTDAAMAERAECVMLNKGPFIADAVTILDDVLARMEQHQHKKMPRLRALRSWK